MERALQGAWRNSSARKACRQELVCGHIEAGAWHVCRVSYCDVASACNNRIENAYFFTENSNICFW